MGINEAVSNGSNQYWYNANDEGDLRKLIITVHEGVRQGCGECHSIFVSCRDLKIVHQGVRYYCSQYEYKTKKLSYLIMAKQLVHEDIL